MMGHILLTMAVLTIEVLRKVIDNLPTEYTVEYDNGTTISPIEDKIELDVSNKRVIFK